MKSRLQDNDTGIHSKHNKGKFVVSKRIIRALTNKIKKQMTCSIYIDKVYNIVDSLNNTYHRTIKMKHIDVNFDVENNDKDPKFKVSGLVRITICKNIFGKGYTQNWSDEYFCS